MYKFYNLCFMTHRQNTSKALEHMGKSTTKMPDPNKLIKSNVHFKICINIK